MGRFTQYPAASTADYADATTFLIANEDGVIKQASLDGLMSNYGSDIRSTSLVIASADVLQLNTTPQTIVAAQGAGTVIVPVSAIFRATYNSATYATNLSLLIRHSGSLTPITSNSNKLGFTSNTINQFTLRDVTSSDQFIEDADLEVYVDVGNPTTGDSDIELFVLYRVINV
jgi:hypothetical protein